MKHSIGMIGAGVRIHAEEEDNIAVVAVGAGVDEAAGLGDHVSRQLRAGAGGYLLAEGF